MAQANDSKGQAVSIVKMDDDLRVVWGWASVITDKGKVVVDHHGDTITEADLLKAAHGFAGIRRIKAMHKGDPIGEMVESVVMTPALQKALGIDLGLTGWLIAAKITDDTAWKQIKDGKMPAFSIGGRGRREVLAEAA